MWWQLIMRKTVVFDVNANVRGRAREVDRQHGDAEVKAMCQNNNNEAKCWVVRTELFIAIVVVVVDRPMLPMHGRIIMSRGGDGSSSSSSNRRRWRRQVRVKRCCDAAGAVSVTAPADVVPSGLTNGGSDEKSRSNWPAGWPATMSDAERPVKQSCMFNVFRMNTTFSSWPHSYEQRYQHANGKITAQYNDAYCCKYLNCYCCWRWYGILLVHHHHHLINQILIRQ